MAEPAQSAAPIEAQCLLDALEPGGRFTFQTFDDGPKPKRMNLAQIIHGTIGERAHQLQRLNSAGAGVYVTVNQTDGKGREYANVTKVRALFVDLDGSPIAPVRAGPLMPHLVVESSPDRWHAYWLVDGIALDDFRPLQRGLIARFGGDKACIDLPRVMRLPGFDHRKGEPFHTRVHDFNELPRYTLDDVLQAFGWASPADAAPKPKAVRATPATAAAPTLTNTDRDIDDDLREALTYLPADDYSTWISIGHSLKTWSGGKWLWLAWSSTSSKYDEADALKRWDGFHPGQTGYKAVFAAAQAAGWNASSAPSIKRKRAMRSENRPISKAENPPPEGGTQIQHESAAAELDTTDSGLVQRFELVYGTKQVWDTTLNCAMAYGAFMALVGKSAASTWLDGGMRRVRMLPGSANAKDAEKARKKERKGASEEATATKLEWMLPRYALIYSTEDVFDREDRIEMSLASLRAFAGLKATRDWGDHPLRQVVRKNQVIFDPRRAVDDPDVCNLWGGWPIQAAKGSAADQEIVRRWLAVLHYACNESDAVFEWLLKWIAYPLRYPGTKMKTSVVMHGPEGSGKNTIWDAVRRFYGNYGSQIGQTQLEDKYTDWVSAMLFIVGNEVLHRQEQVTQKGRLKSLISDETLRIDRKYLSGRIERNCANMAFLSNELVPLSLDPGDRRQLVIWTPPPHPDGRAFYNGLGEDQMPDSAVSALYDYFLQIDLGDFDAHTKPPLTQAKQDLIDANLESQQRFVRDWMAGELPVPYGACTSRDLYHCYLFWCREYGERFPKPENKFAARAKKELPYGNKYYLLPSGRKQGMCYVPRPVDVPPPDEKEYIWLGEQILAFREALRQWRTDSNG